MAELSETQIDLVSAYIKQHGIAQEALHDDLLDHVCTSIEYRIGTGQSFEDALVDTIKLFGPGGLKQVQNETFELLTEMNETMKKVTFGFGLTSTFLLLAGTIFKLNHWLGAETLVLSGAMLLVIGYLPMLLFHKIKESPKSERLLHISGFMGLSLTAMGVLFKIMHWPGAAILLNVGMGILAFAYVPIYFVKRYKVSPNKSVTLSSSIVATASIILIFALMKSGNSQWYEHAVMQVQEELDKSEKHAASLNGILYESADFEGSTDLQQETEALVNYLEDAKLHLIATAQNVSKEAAAQMPLGEIGLKHNMNISSEMFLSEGSYSGAQIEKELNDFRAFVIEHYPQELKATLTENLPFKTAVDFQTPQNQSQNWIEYHFDQVPIFTVLSQLTAWQLEARNLETNLLMYRYSQPRVSNPPS